MGNVQDQSRCDTEYPLLELSGMETPKPPKTVIEAFRRLLGVITPNVDNLIRRCSAGNMKGREVSLIEFKASYVPSPNDSDGPDTCQWNVIKAIVGMANSQGGCVILGLAEDPNTKKIIRGNGDPDGILSRPGTEDKDLAAHTESALFAGQSFRDKDGNLIRVDPQFWDRLSEVTCGRDGFIVCRSHADGDAKGFPVVAIFVNPVPDDQDLIAVELMDKKNGEPEYAKVYYHRSYTKPETLPLVRRKWTIQQVSYREGGEKVYREKTIENPNNAEFEKSYFQFVQNRDSMRVLPALLELLGDVNSPNKKDNAEELPSGLLYGCNHPEKLFVGREKDTATVQNDLHEYGIVVVHGGGGKGKTSLVEHVANKWLKDAGGFSFWIDAERIQDWKSVFGAVLDLDPRIRKQLPENKTDSAEKQTAEERTPEKSISEWLLRKSDEGTPVLLILDNVEEPNLFADKRLQAWFGKRLPRRFQILATSRIKIPRENVDNPIHQISLDYLDPIVARQLLVTVARKSDWNEETLSEDEKKALDKLVTLTHGHAWTIILIGSYMRDIEDPHDGLSVPMSFRSAFDIYNKQGIVAFSPDDPLYCKKRLAPTLDYIRKLKNGGVIFDLARVAALVARDGRAEKHLLHAFWKRISGEFDNLFETAVTRLVGCSLFDSDSEQTIEMHRNTQEVLCAEANDSFYELAGPFLRDNPVLDLRRWPDLLKNGVPSKFCPVRLMDNALLRKVLPFDWSLLDAELIEDFNGEDICWALLNGPETIRNLPWRWNRLEETGSSHVRFSTFFPNPLSKTNDPCFPCSPRGDFRPAYWTNVLLKIPSLIRHCDLSQLSHDDLWVLTKAMPTLVDANPFFRDNPRGIVHYLMSHPDAATDQMLSSLDPEDWQFLVHERNQFDGQMPSAVRSLLERASSARDRGYGNDDCEFDDEYDSGWYEEPEQSPEDREEERIQEQFRTFIPSKVNFLSSENGREIAVYLMLHPEDSHLRSLEALESDDWLILFAERPEFIEEYGTKQVLDASSSAWVEALSDNPELVNECGSEFELSGGWDMFSGEDWVNLLLSRPELGSHCNASKLNGLDWGKLLVRYPSLAEKCPWKKLSESDYAALLVSHPEWAKNYGLSFSGLNEEQWIALLRHHPEFGDQCHIRFSEKSAFDLALLVKEQPVLLNALSAYGSMSLFDPLLLFARGDDGTLPWYYLIRKTIREESEPKVDFYDEWQNHKLPIRWDALSCSEWDGLLERHPECVDIFNKKKVWLHFSGADWTSKLLSNLPEWFDRCDWTKLTGDDWIRLLAGGQDRDDFGFFFDENGIIQRGRLIKGRRQLVRSIPEGVSIEALMKIATSLPMSKRLLKNNPFVQAIFDSAKSHLEENLQSKQTTIPLKPNEIVWPHMDWVPFCQDTKWISVPNLLQSLVKGIDVSYHPHEKKQKLNLLSNLVFECQDMSAADICILERTIAETQLEHGFFEDALVVLDRIPSFVEAENSSAFNADSCDLSLAFSDCFYHYSRGDVFWKKGEFQKAVTCFSQALSASRARFEERVFHLLHGKPTPHFRFSQRSFNGSSMWISQSISGEQILYDPHFDVRSISRIKQDLSDCKQSIPFENSVRRWFHRLNWSFDPHPDGRQPSFVRSDAQF